MIAAVNLGIGALDFNRQQLTTTLHMELADYNRHPVKLYEPEFKRLTEAMLRFIDNDLKALGELSQTLASIMTR